jgi:hypothetical protein
MSPRLASLTGKNPVPELTAKQFHFEKEKFQAAGLTPMGSELVKPARVKECPVHMEARVLEPACQCCRVTQRASLAVCTHEGLLGLSFGSIPNEIVDVSRQRRAVLLDLVYCGRGR